MALTDPGTPGATPLDSEQIKGLRLAFITTQGELNRQEQANILRATRWAQGARSAVMPGMLSLEFALELHRRMYGDVWAWAGRQRTTDTNIGVDFTRIGVALRELFDDATCWLDVQTYEPVELAVRLHHRLVAIHPFLNGNGRHARFYADLILARHFKRERLTWGGGPLGNDDLRRADYIAALRAADNHDYSALLKFARS
ncbi:MAG TPA: mobile mystery protein B [Steroidobacteraceae bacterium]|jgi:Fic-DOC domain mobile mystery protein B